MFGVVRVSSTPVDSLERPPSKILKNDPLSIYEATLMKLKLGSKHDDLSSHSDQAVEKETDSDSTCASEGSRVKINADCAFVNNSECTQITVASHEEAMTIDADCSSACTSPISICSESIGSTKHQKKPNVSVLYLFSKFRNTQNAPKLSNVDSMEMENTYSSANSSSGSSDCLSLSSNNSPEAIMEEEHGSSLSVCWT